MGAVGNFELSKIVSKHVPATETGVRDCVAESEHRAGVEPALPLYESGILATRRPVLAHRFFRVGPEGLEPSPAWVRTRNAAANTSVPKAIHVGAEGVEPSPCCL